jgi:PAS domain S-box-containing protein
MDHQPPLKEARSQRPRRRGGPPLSSASGGSAFDAVVSQSFLELAPDAMLVVDANGQIVQVNQQTEELFGYARSALLGQPVELLLPERFRALHAQHREAYAAQPYKRPMGSGLALVGRRQDGREFPAEISLSPFEQNDELFTLSSIRDVSERQRLEVAERAAQAAAARRLALLQAVLDHLPGGAYLVRGPDARLVLANRAAETVWGARWTPGQTMAEFLQATGVRYFAENGQPLPLAELATVQISRGGAPHARQLREVIRRPDGTRVPILLNAVRLEAALLDQEAGSAEVLPAVPPEPMAAATGTADPDPAALVVLQEISAIQATEQLKDEFINLAAQELRGPVAVIGGFADLLRVQTARGQGPAQADWQHEALTEIGSATGHLQALVDDLLDLTRLQAGRLRLYPVPLELVGVVRRCLTRLQVTAPRHTLTLDAPEGPVLLAVDAMRLEQVLGQLVGNAIKFSPQGGPITVTVRADASAGQAEVRIQDQGIGIPTDEQGQLFERFTRASNVHEHRIPGSGLGLYICRELVERHGGQLWLESVEGAGTTVFLTLPLLSPGDAARAAEGETDSAAGSPAPKDTPEDEAAADGRPPPARGSPPPAGRDRGHGARPRRRSTHLERSEQA